MEVAGLKEEIEIVEIHAFKEEMMEGVELLFIATPTRAFRPSKEIKSFVVFVKQHVKNIKVAVFDTRMRMTDDLPWLLKKLEKRFGYAVDTMEKILGKNEDIELLESNYFYVGGSEGPLEDGEVERLKEWALHYIE